MAFFIRPATVDDVDDILRLVIELATYEKEPESVKATPELYRKNLFETPYAHTLLAISGTPDAPGKAVGLAMYFFNYSTWTAKPGIYLEDLYVDPTFRGQGLGKALFAELGKVAEEKLLPQGPISDGYLRVLQTAENFISIKDDCGRIDWSVLKWNQPSINFYEKALGAKPMTEWMGMRLEGEQIQNLRKFAS